MKPLLILTFCIFASTAWAQATFFGQSSRAHATSGNVTVTLPASIQSNDFIVCVVASLDNVSVTSVVGTGTYSALDSGTTNGTGFITSVWWVQAATGEANPVVTHTAGGAITAGCWVYRGIPTTSPIGVTGTTNANASSTSDPAPSITANKNNSVAIWAGGIASASQANSGPGAPWTDRGLGGSAANPEVTVMDGVFQNGVSTGIVTETWNNTAAVNNGMMFTILPGPVPTLGLLGVGQ